MLQQYKKFFVLLVGLYSCAAFSVENTALFAEKDNPLFTPSFVATLSSGPAIEKAGRTQTLNLAPDIDKTYTADRSQNTMLDYDLFLGIQKSLTAKLLSQIGLDVGVTRSATLSGDIWDDADPQFNNYTYQYHINHSQIALKGKLIGNFNWPVLPWVSATLGAGFNRSYGFSNTPTIYQAVESPNFSSQTITAFTCAVGVGLQYPLNQNWQMGLGYEFANWGRSALGPAMGSTTNQALKLSHLYVQSLMLNLTYLA